MRIQDDYYKMTWYIAEFDPEIGEAFCYADNSTDPEFSEWGYSNVINLYHCGCVENFHLFRCNTKTLSQHLSKKNE